MTGLDQSGQFRTWGVTLRNGGTSRPKLSTNNLISLKKNAAFQRFRLPKISVTSLNSRQNPPTSRASMVCTAH